MGANSQSKGPGSVWGMWLSEVLMGQSRRHRNKAAGGGDTKVGVVSMSRLVKWVLQPTE